MNPKNLEFIEGIFDDLTNQKVKYRVIDKRWKKGGDVDIVVAKDSLKSFEKVILKSGFRRKGFWPPQARAYQIFINDENLWVGGHIGGYIGGLGGGLGRLGKMFNPVKVLKGNDVYLSDEEQIFILLYKYRSRNKKKKYEAYYDQLIKKKLNHAKLKRLLPRAFKNSGDLLKQIKHKRPLAKIEIEFNTIKSFSVKLQGRFNRFLKFCYKVVRPAPYVALVGCNGTGKSTQMRNLTRKLTDEKIKVGSIYSGRFRGQFLPINFIGKFLKPDIVERGKNHHKGTPRGEDMREVRIFKSPFIRYGSPIVYYIEYMMRYIFKIYPLRVKNDIVITDRAFLDVFNSPNTHKPLCRFFFKIMINPKFILLWNDPKVLHKRRPEFKYKHITEQLDIYNQFSSMYIMKVKTDKVDVVNDIAKRLSKMI